MMRLVTPPMFVYLIKRIRAGAERKEHGLSGEYDSWAEALASSTGYDHGEILEKTKAALLKVKNGEAVYERDSVLFDEIHYSWPLLAGLMWVAARCEGRLDVLDFGGSLGSTYFQNRTFLGGLRRLRWNVIEQPEHVKAGKQYFEDEYLRFYASIGDCLAETRPNVVVLSSVLQYLEEPHMLMRELLRRQFDFVLVDQTPFWNGPQDRLCVQNVLKRVYAASYPCWVFSESLFARNIAKEFEVIAQFQGLNGMASPFDVAWKGMIMRNLRKNPIGERQKD